MSTPLVEVRDLRKHFVLRRSWTGRPKTVLRAVDGVDFAIQRGETFGLVGESGCGKSTLARTLIRLYRPTSGALLFEGQDIAPLNARALRPIRPKMQMIFQDPYASLDTRMNVHDIVAEPLVINGIGTGTERSARVHALLRHVGLNADHARRFPHEFSGGQRQRIGIARALALNPDLVICDEPISALDVSIQAQVVNMLQDLQSEFGLTYLFISHDLSMVRYLCDRIGVMYLGKIVELARRDALYAEPRHPYTRLLLSAMPRWGRTGEAAAPPVSGELPSPTATLTGCRFAGRCPQATDRCRTEAPPLKDTGGGHLAACHFA